MIHGILFFIGMGLVQAVVGCTSTGTQHITQSANDRGVVRNNKAEPDWAVNGFKAKEQNKFFYVTMIDKAYKLNIGIEKAKTFAIGNAAQTVGSDIAKAATAAATGDASVPDGVQEVLDIAVSSVSKVSLSGADVEDLYWEEIKGTDGKPNHYNISILLGVPQSEVERAKKLFLQKFNENGNAVASKERIEKAVADYQGQFEKKTD